MATWTAGAGPFVGLGVVTYWDGRSLERILSPPLLRLQELDRPYMRCNFGYTYRIASLSPTDYDLPWPPCIQWGNRVYTKLYARQVPCETSLSPLTQRIGSPIYRVAHVPGEQCCKANQLNLMT